jgi:hypothetical protein
MTMVAHDLREKAAVEAARLMAARPLTRTKDDDAIARLEGDRPWLACRCGRRARRILRRRLVLLWRVALEDATGSIVASQLVPVVCELRGTGITRRKQSIEHIVDAIEPRIRAVVGDATAPWMQATERIHATFVRARAERLRAIVEHSRRTSAPEWQPGLFDRRAERTRTRSALQDTAAFEEAAERLGASLRSAALSLRTPRLLLVLAS